MSDIYSELAEILEIDTCTDDTPLSQDLISSLALIGLISIIDEKYQVVLNQNQILECTSVRDLLALATSNAA